MTSAPEPTPDAVPTAPPATPGFRVDGLPEPVDPARWVTAKDADPVPGSITAGDAYTAAEVQQG